jgi:IS5 family transposase
MSRLLIPQLSFADLQLQSLGIHLDPTLQRVSDFLKQQADLIELVRKDLERGLKKPAAGRHGITPEQTLRSLVLMRVKNLDYRELRDRIKLNVWTPSLTGKRPVLVYYHGLSRGRLHVRVRL